MDGRRRLVLLLLAAGLLFFSRLDLPLLETQEARYAEIPRAMLADDSWLTPVLHGQPYLDKPPLLYWLVMLSYSLFGVHDWAAHLVPAFAGILTVLTVYLWGRQVAGERVGFLGALLLCLSARYVYLARLLTFDTLLCLFVTASLACAHVGLRERKRRWLVLAGLACGLAVLTKGLVACVLILPLAALPLLDRATARPRLGDIALFILLLTLSAGPWFVFAALRHPGFASEFFWRHHFVRFVEPFDHAEPFWFHGPGLLLGILPWTLLLPGLARFLWRGLGRGVPGLLFFLACAAWAIVFFSLSGCKRAVYILPALPPLALGLGCYLDAVLPWMARWARPATSLVMLGGVGGAIAAAISGLLSWPVTMAVVGVVVAGKVSRLPWGKRLACQAIRCPIAVFLVLLLAIHLVLPAYAERFGLRHHVQNYEEEEAIICYPHGWDSVSFYLRRDVPAFSVEQRDALIAELTRRPRTLLFLKGGRACEELLAVLPETLLFTPDRRVGTVVIGWVKRAP